MDMKQIMKQAQEMQKKMEQIQQSMAVKEAEGKAGGGLVTARVNGKGEVTALNIAAELLKPEDKEVVQDLVLAAIADAKGKIESEFNDSMSGIASEMGLPAGFKFS
jgi:hypothetical protein